MTSITNGVMFQIQDKTPYPISRKFYDDDVKRAELNRLSEAAVITFTPSDIRYIFVKADADIPPQSTL